MMSIVNHRLNTLATIPIVAASILLMTSCYGDANVGDLTYDLVVATDRDIEVDFSDYETYYISDTIPFVSDDTNDSVLVGAPALKIVDEIKIRLDSLGFVFVDRKENPDLGIVPAVLNTTYKGGRCSGWWGGYPGYWDPIWWGYPGYRYYYPFCGYYSYDTGTVTIDMIDLKNTSSSENLKAIWTASMFGAYSKKDETNLTRTIRAINQAFEQSYYFENQ